MLLIFDNLYEIKLRVLYLIFSFVSNFFISYMYSETLMYICALPFIDKFDSKKFMFTNLMEAFSGCLLISLNVALFFVILLSVIFCFDFLKPGLYKREFLVLNNFFKIGSLSLFSSIVFVYFWILPSFIDFFVAFENSKLLELTFEAKIVDYLQLVFKLMLWINFVFQLPGVFFVLICLGLIEFDVLIHRRKECICLCFVIGALISPPDVFMQLLIGMPLLIFLEISILTFILIEEYVLVGFGE